MRPSVSQDLWEFLEKPNRPQLGSFGEAIFQTSVARFGNEAIPLHDQRTDFTIGGQRVDVKTSTKYLATSIPVRSVWSGKRENGVSYALVEFHHGGVRVSMEGHTLTCLKWDECNVLWDQWRSGRFRRSHNPGVGVTRRLPAEIQEAIDNLFIQHGYRPPYILHRTCQWLGDSPGRVRGFQEAPHNLLPSQRALRDRRGWTVYLMFKSSPPSLDLLLDVIAFEDSREPEIPLLAQVSLGDKLKIDLKRLPASLRYRSLQELEGVL